MNSASITDLLTSSIMTLLGAFVSWYLRYKYGEYKDKKIKAELSESKLVQTILEQQLIDYNCERAFILQRHNGGKYGTGKSMIKLSTTYEALQEGVSTEFKEYQNLPMSLYTGLIDSAENGDGVFESVELIEDILTKAFFVQRGTKSAIVYSVKRGKELVAIVGFEWTHNQKDMSPILNDIQTDKVVLGETLSKLL